MKQIGGTIYLSKEDICDAGIQKNTVNLAIRRGIPTIRDQKDGRITLIAWTDLPAAWQKRFREKVGDPKTLVVSQSQAASKEALAARQSQLAALVVVSQDDLVELAMDGGLDKATILDYARAAAWLRLLAEAKPKALGFSSKPDLYAAAAAELATENLSGLKATSAEYLRKKVTAWKRQGLQCVISGKFGNTNSLKLTPAAQALIRDLYSDERRFPISQVHEYYTKLAKEEGLPVVCEATVDNYLRQPKVQAECLKRRYSNTEFRDVYDPVIHRRRPTHSDDLWSLDGSAMELWYRDGNDLRRLYWVFAVDAATWYIPGWAVGETENGHLVRQCVQMACRTGGKLPHQLQFDNGSAFKSAESMEWMQSLAKITPTAVGNARSKVAEPWQSHFQRRVLKLFGNHSGGNITARSKTTHANRDHIKATRHEFPDREGAIAQIAKAVTMWNNMAIAGKVPAQEYAKESPRARVIPADLMASIFWIKRPKQVKYTNKGLIIEVAKERLIYEVGGTVDQRAEWLANNIGRKFWVRTDPQDDSMIALYDDQDRLVTYAELLDDSRKVPMALVDFEEGDGENLADRMAVKKRLVEIVEERVEDTRIAAHAIHKGAIDHQRLHKDAWNASEEDLKRLEIIGAIAPQKRKNNKLDLHGAGSASLQIVE